MNILQKFEAKELAKQTAGKTLLEFSTGDTVIVNLKIVEGDRERVQAYEGVCIARGGQGINESFTVRKISYGEGVERVFPLHSPRIESIELVRRGSVRRAKLYYLRDRQGKSARIVERTTGHGLEEAAAAAAAASAERKVAKKEKAAAKAEGKKEPKAPKAKKEKAPKAE
ncbi:MAG: rplS [Micavibrio sp.]|nr:rplS [Micavibrio sp.]